MLTLVEAPGGPRAFGGAGREVQAWRDEAGRAFARGFASPAQRWIDWPGVGLFAFGSAPPRVEVYRDAVGGPALVDRTFERTLQPIILQATGWQALHASAFLRPEGVVGLVGHSRAGKSTLAYAMDAAGFAQFADDALVVRVDRDVTACALPFSAQLRPAAQLHFRNVAGPRHRAARPSEAPLSALIALRQSELAPAVPHGVPLEPGAAFRLLLSHAHCFDQADIVERQRLVNDYLTVVARVPVFDLCYRPDFRQFPSLVDAGTRDGTFRRVGPLVTLPRPARTGSPLDTPRLLALFLWFSTARHLVPLPTLARWAWRGQDHTRSVSVDAVVRSVLHVAAFAGWPERDCLPRSLLLYRELSRAGADPSLVVGLRQADGAVEGHCWVETEGRPVAEPRDERFAPFWVFGRAGAIFRRPEPQTV